MIQQCSEQTAFPLASFTLLFLFLTPITGQKENHQRCFSRPSCKSFIVGTFLTQTYEKGQTTYAFLSMAHISGEIVEGNG